MIPERKITNMSFIIKSVSSDVLMVAVFLLKPETKETPVHKQTQTKIPTPP